MAKVVCILQSNYIPWRGYFDLIRQSNDFVFYDEAQYTKNDWRNRNIIVTERGKKWLTLPVETSGRMGQSVFEAQIQDHKWASKHLDSINQVYAKSKYADIWLPKIRHLYQEIAGLTSLSEVNRRIIMEVCIWLGIETRFHNSTAIEGPLGQTERLVGIVAALGGDSYISGPSAKAYLDQSRFMTRGINIKWMSYPEYPAYKQIDGNYIAGVSIFDALLNVGLKGLY